jgi:hypothetical protein
MSEVISRKQLPAEQPTVAEIQKRKFSAQSTKLMWEYQPYGSARLAACYTAERHDENNAEVCRYVLILTLLDVCCLDTLSFKLNVNDELAFPKFELDKIIYSVKFMTDTGL